MNTLSYVVAIFGLLLGVAITLQINRLLSGQQSTAASLVNSIMHYNSTSVQLPATSNIHTDIDKTVEVLENERDALQKRLRLIEKELLQLSASSISKHKLEANNQSKHENLCPYKFKVYVYEIPTELESVRIGEEARRNQTLHICHKCILEQFSLEYIVNDFFTKFCGRTYDPDEADFFYLPLVRDAEFRLSLSHSTRNRAPSSTEWSLLTILEKNDSSLWKSVFNVTDKYWHAHGGADHIIAMPAPVTNIRHETSQRGFFHYMMHLYPPIFLCLEYSVGFVQEYPVCSTQKNIVVPYPTTDPELFNGKLTSAKVERKYLLYYAGGMHGDCVEVRRAMKILMQNSTRLSGVIPPVRSNQAEREHGFLAATFCPIPIGDSPSSKRMYDVLNFGCIPVVLSDDLIWAYSDQSGGPLNHTDFSLQMPQSVVHFTARKTLARYAGNPAAMGATPSGARLYDLLQSAYAQWGDYEDGAYLNPLVLVLRSIPQKDVQLLQAGVHKAAPYYRYYNMHSEMRQIPLTTHELPDGGAIQLLAAQLTLRKQRGVRTVRDECAKERSAPHKYISRYACDGRDKVESLVRRRRLLLR